jgi:hypothetical protein
MGAALASSWAGQCYQEAWTGGRTAGAQQDARPHRPAHQRPSRYAVDTSKRGQALVSVPVFCGHLVERIVAEAYDQWDVTLLDTDVKL